MTRPGDEASANEIKTLQTEIEKHRLNALLVDELEKENERLRLQVIRQNAHGGTDPNTQNVGLLPDTGGGLPGHCQLTSAPLPSIRSRSRKDYGELLAKYTLLTGQHQRLQRAFDTLVSKYRGEKKTLDAWIEYVDKHHPKWRDENPRLRAISGPDEQGRSSDGDSPGAQVNVIPDALSTHMDDPLTSCDTSRTEPPPKPTREAVRYPNEASELNRGSLKEPRAKSPDSTQETDDSAHESFGPKGHEPYSTLESADAEPDLPVVVFARSLKRKRAPASAHAASGRVEPQTGTTNDPIRVKSECSSSSPIPAASLPDTVPETLDLDDLGRSIKTPRKNPRKYQPADGEDASDDGDHEGVTDEESASPELFSNRANAVATFQQMGVRDRGATNVAQASNPESQARRPLTRVLLESGAMHANSDLFPKPTSADSFLGVDRTTTFADASNGRHRKNGAPAMDDLPEVKQEDAQDRRFSAPPETSSSRKGTSSPGKRKSRRTDNILQPTSNNIKLLPVSASSKTSLNTRMEWKPSYDRSKMALIAEDGEITPEDSPNAKTRTSLANGEEDAPREKRQRTAATKSTMTQRLTNLLEQPVPDKAILTPDKALPGNRLQQADRRKTSHGDEANLFLNQQLPTPSSERPTAPRKLAPSRNRQEPLRQRPLQSLLLENFKVNPKYNQGVNYAFSETVRGRERRRCLPGCTRPECCGDVFRKSIQIGGLPLAPGSGSSRGGASSEEEDTRLLEEYLGASRGELATMTKEDREEMLLQARTKQFADKHGRHRQAYERRRTPPGFWRTDMPTTQEMEADREEANRIERTKVEERYREAIRPGGRWIFADERT